MVDESVDVTNVEDELEEELEDEVGSEDLEEELDSRVSEDDEAAEALESEVSEDDEDEDLDLDEEDEEESEFVEAKRGSKKDKDEFEDEDIVEERFYTIPLRKVWIVPRKKRAPKAARVVRSFVIKHMKVRTEAEFEEDEPERLVIDPEVNEILWSRGIEKPPRKIRVRVVRDKEGVVTVLPAEGD